MSRISVSLKPSENARNKQFSFGSILKQHGHNGLKRNQLLDLQINIGKLCNQACTHCHVDAGPKRTEIMTWETMSKIVEWAKQNKIVSVDITGGAPELNPDFRRFVVDLRKLDIRVISRCNLTVLFEPGQQDLADWYAANQIQLVCSLPCYTQDNTDKQRGKGVFDKSITALQLLNSVGYGTNPDLTLDLVYNPGGAFLPPEQRQLEIDYKEKLFADYTIIFNKLYALANLPVSRFEHSLTRDGEFDDYMQLLLENFNPKTIDSVMCKSLLSVDWTGKVYDCDFNQMLDLPLADKNLSYLWDISAQTLYDQKIATRYHCFGCTAGSGSSCGGSLS